jgi:hypothetical protein
MVADRMVCWPLFFNRHFEPRARAAPRRAVAASASGAPCWPPRAGGDGTQKMRRGAAQARAKPRHGLPFLPARQPRGASGGPARRHVCPGAPLQKRARTRSRSRVR